MSWHYRNPLTFPAIFIEATIEASRQPDTPTFVYSSDSLSDVQAKAQLLRWFRWCVKQVPGTISRLDPIIEAYSFRSSVKIEPNNRAVLYILAREDRLGAMAALNPDLAGLIALA